MTATEVFESVGGSGEGFQIEEGESVVSVDAIDGAKPFWTVTADGRVEQLGAVAYRDYEGSRRLRRLMFWDGVGREYTLGTCSNRFKIVDHLDCLMPFLERGFVIRRRFVRRGTEGAFLLSHPEIVFDDLIQWDGLNVLGGGKSELSVMIWTDAYVGHASRFIAGFFRQVCSNGLVASLLNIGTMKVSHLSHTSEMVEKFCEDLVIGGLEGGSAALANVPWAEVSAAGWPIKLLLGSVGKEYIEMIQDLPGLVHGPLQTLMAYNSETRMQLAEHLVAACSEDKISVLDILNAITNVVEDRRDLYFGLDNTCKAVCNLIAIGALMSGARTFRM